MRIRHPLGRAPGVAVFEVRCDDRAPDWSAPEPSTGYGAVFVRRGGFRRRVHGAPAFVDPTIAYFERPGDEQEYAHPLPDGDVCTFVELSESLAADLYGGDPALPADPVRTDGAVDLAHRTLVARSRLNGCGFHLTETVIRLVSTALRRRHPERAAAGRPATAAARRRLAEHVREALATDPSGWDLPALARLSGTSPYHLSRTFHAENGQTLSRYRNRLRVRLAMERIDAGERNLASLAADLGFADHAHLTRVVRAETGHPPARLRLLLSGRDQMDACRSQ